MLTHEILGARLKEARSASGFTQQDAAEKLGISRQKLVNIEKGTGPVDTVLLKQMADLYGFTVDYFFREEDENEVDIKIAFRAGDLGESDQDTINWARKVLLCIKNLQDLTKEV
jgi:transcriptional regulator with XRE-family HTH domain